MRNLMWAGLAAGCLLTASGVSFAQDTVRLGGPSTQIDMHGDTDLVRGGGGHGGGGHGGGGRGGFGGYGHASYGRGGYGYGGYGRGGYGYGGYGRGYGWGGYGRGYGYGYGRGWGGYGWGGYGWGGYGWGGGYGGYYYPYSYPVYYPYYYTPYYSDYYYYPIVGQSAPTVNLQASYYSEPPAYNQPFQGTLPLPGGNGTYPYNGGPSQPIPMPAPSGDANPANDRGIIPLDGKLVSFPSQTTGGFSPVGLSAVQPRSSTTTVPVPAPASKTTKTAPLPRVIYPAYGEAPR
jgi:hypothetical protein